MLLKIFLIWSSGGPFDRPRGTILSNFTRGHHEVHFCEIILNSDQWFRRCCLKDFLSGALAALLFGVEEPQSFEISLNLLQWFRRRCRSKKKVTDTRTLDEQ